MTIRTEHIDKWVRGYLADTVVVDSRDPMLFWEPEFPVPAYAFDAVDVRTDLLVAATGSPPAQPWFFLPHGPVSQWFDVVVDDRRAPFAAWVRDDPALRERIVLSWQPGLLDRWTEEAEDVGSHPRDPHQRVEAIASTRHVTVTIDGDVIANSHRPVLLFETGLPTRYYLPVADIDTSKLVSSPNRSHCPYKGVADAYWDLKGGSDYRNVAWSYTAPYPAVAVIAGLISFYNEMVDITVDGVLLDRPVSPFSEASHRPGS